MVLDLLIKLAVSAFDLGLIGFRVSIPVFALVLIISILKKQLAKKFKLNWLYSSIAASYAVLLLLLALLYFVPFFSAVQETDLGQIPEPYRNTVAETTAGYAFLVFRLLLVTAILTLLVLPLEFIAVYVYEKISKSKTFKNLNYYIRLYATAFVLSVLLTFAVLFLFPWAVNGIIYLIFYGFGA